MVVVLLIWLWPSSPLLFVPGQASSGAAGRPVSAGSNDQMLCTKKVHIVVLFVSYIVKMLLLLHTIETNQRTNLWLDG